MSVSVTVVSSNTGVGTISSTPLTIAGGSGSASTSLVPVSAGFTGVTVSAPQFTPAQVGATFTNSVLIVNDVTVGKGLQETVNLILPSPAGPSGVQVTVAATAPVGGGTINLKLAAQPTDAGTDNIVVTVPAGQQSVQFYVQALANTGTSRYTASTAGVGDGVGTATFAKSGIVIQPSPSMSGSLATGTATATIYTAVLNGSNAPQSPQALAGGVALDVPVASGNSGVATVPATVSIAPGSSSAPLSIHLVSTGSSIISVSQPVGFQTPNSLTATTLTVNP